MINTDNFKNLNETELQNISGGDSYRNIIQIVSDFLSDLFGKGDKK